jgi:predicted CopG family antitoxin
MKTTTIAINVETKEQLKALGNKGQTYDELIEELIGIAKRSAFFEKQKNILATERFVKASRTKSG